MTTLASLVFQQQQQQQQRLLFCCLFFRARSLLITLSACRCQQQTLCSALAAAAPNFI